MDKPLVVYIYLVIEMMPITASPACVKILIFSHTKCDYQVILAFNYLQSDDSQENID